MGNGLMTGKFPRFSPLTLSLLTLSPGLINLSICNSPQKMPESSRLYLEGSLR